MTLMFREIKLGFVNDKRFSKSKNKKETIASLNNERFPHFQQKL